MTLTCEFDSGVSAKARLGLVVLATDETLEADFRSLFAAPGIGLFHARIPMQPSVTVEGLKAMETELPKVLELLPKEDPLDAVGYACTSAATVIGQTRIAEIVRSVHPEAEVTDPISAVIAACRKVGARRVAMITPYLLDICQAMIDLLGENGIEVTAFGSFERPLDAEVARITPQSILDAAVDIGGVADADAVFAACTNLNTLPVIDEVERRLGKPMVTSNQALAWHLAQLAGISDSVNGPGQLFQRDNA